MSIFETIKGLVVRAVKGLVYSAFVIISLSSIALFILQDKLLYINYGFKVPMLERRPHEYRVPWRNVFIETEDGEVLHGWLLFNGELSTMRQLLKKEKLERECLSEEDNLEGVDRKATTSAESTDTKRDEIMPDDLLPPLLTRPTPSQPFKLSSLTGKEANNVLIFFHGNAGDVTGRLANLVDIHRQMPKVDATLIIDYRGYGRSTGKPTEKGLMIDARSTVKYVKEVLGAEKIIVFGRSLGGAVALSLQDQPDLIDYINMIILENTFTNIPDMIRHIFPKWLSWVSYFTWHKWNSIERISRVKCPLLMVSGQLDEIVPSHMMKSLFKAATVPQKSLLKFKDGKHNETFMLYGYYARVHAFISEYL